MGAEITFIGRKACIVLRGFQWGYGGTGPMGLVRALYFFGMDREQALMFVVKEKRHKWAVLF